MTDPAVYLVGRASYRALKDSTQWAMLYGERVVAAVDPGGGGRAVPGERRAGQVAERRGDPVQVARRDEPREVARAHAGWRARRPDRGARRRRGGGEDLRHAARQAVGS